MSVREVQHEQNRALHKLVKLSKRDLEMIGSSFTGKSFVVIHQTDEGFWTLSIRFDGKEDVHAISTARGETKMWRNFMAVVAFVHENCRFATSVTVEIGTWTLIRES